MTTGTKPDSHSPAKERKGDYSVCSDSEGGRWGGGKTNERESRCKRSYRAQYDEAVETGTSQSLTTEHNVEGGSPVG